MKRAMRKFKLAFLCVLLFPLIAIVWVFDRIFGIDFLDFDDDDWEDGDL